MKLTPAQEKELRVIGRDITLVLANLKALPTEQLYKLQLSGVLSAIVHANDASAAMDRFLHKHVSKRPPVKKTRKA